MAEIDRNKLAVALKYERDKSDAPVVAAKGKGYMAQAIIELAERYGIEVRQDKDLAKCSKNLISTRPFRWKPTRRLRKFFPMCIVRMRRRKGIMYEPSCPIFCGDGTIY
jgi:hypothetical protein